MIEARRMTPTGLCHRNESPKGLRRQYDAVKPLASMASDTRDLCSATKAYRGCYGPKGWAIIWLKHALLVCRTSDVMKAFVRGVKRAKVKSFRSFGSMVSASSPRSYGT